MAQPTADKEVLLKAAFELFYEVSEGIKENKAIEKLEAAAPGFNQRQYKTAWAKVLNLFDCACKLVFRWSSDKPPGTTFELPDENRIFIDELTNLCNGFSEEQYLSALEYGFEKAIF